MGEPDLFKSRFTSTKLKNAYLGRTNLHEAILYRADIGNVEMSYAGIGRTVFWDVDLTKVKGLDTVQHRYPSLVALETIYRSKGNIPESFLRGCGVPENFITYMHSLIGKAFDFYFCFASHSAKDKHFCERLMGCRRRAGQREAVTTG